MSQFFETGCRPDTAAGAVAQFLRVKTPGAIEAAGATDVALGTMELPCLAAGPCTVRLRTAQGTRKMVVSEAITAGNAVYAAASGKIASSGTVYEGIALETSTANNDVIEVMTAPNVDIPASAGVTTPVVTFNGLTGANEIRVPDNLADGLSIEGTHGDFIVFTTTNGSELITVSEATTFSDVVNLTGNAANAAGAGIEGDAAVFETSVERVGGLIKTTILVDLTGLNSGDADGDIIGKADTAACHIGQITAAINGTIVAGRVSCLETPAGGEPDIDLYSATVATGVEDTAIGDLTETALLAAAADWTGALAPKGLTANPAADSYLYLVASGGATNDTYTAGIMLIELWGTA